MKNTEGKVRIRKMPNGHLSHEAVRLHMETAPHVTGSKTIEKTETVCKAFIENRRYKKRKIMLRVTEKLFSGEHMSCRATLTADQCEELAKALMYSAALVRKHDERELLEKMKDLADKNPDWRTAKYNEKESNT